MELKVYYIISLLFGGCPFLNVQGYKERHPFYWRDFNGTIPKTAFVASNVSGVVKYVGRALVDGGITVVEITPNATEVQGPMNGIKKASVEKGIVEILCDGELNGFWTNLYPAWYKNENLQEWKLRWTRGGKELKKNSEIYYVGKYIDKKTKKEYIGKIIKNGHLCYIPDKWKKPNCTDENQSYKVLVVNYLKLDYPQQD